MFPSDYAKNLVVTPLPKQGTLSPESELSILVSGASNSQSNPDASRSLPEQQSNSHSQLNTTHSGKTFNNKNVNYSNSDLLKRFGNQNKKERSHIWALLKIGVLEYWARLRFRRDSADSIWMPDLSQKLEEGICKDTCQFRLHYQRGNYYRHDIN